MAMPEMPGDILVDKVLSLNPELLTIIITGYSSRMSEQKAAKMGVKALLMKPLNKKKLASTVRQVLDGAKGYKKTNQAVM